MYHSDSAILIQKIQSICTTKEQCAEWYLFTPIVFTRLMFPGVNYPAVYHRTLADGTDEVLKFSESPIYNKLYEAVKSRWKEFSEEDKVNVMFRYHQYHNIAFAIENGADPSKIIVQEIRIL